MIASMTPGQAGLLPPRVTRKQRLNDSDASFEKMVYQSDGLSGLYVLYKFGWIKINVG